MTKGCLAPLLPSAIPCCRASCTPPLLGQRNPPRLLSDRSGISSINTVVHSVRLPVAIFFRCVDILELINQVLQFSRLFLTLLRPSPGNHTSELFAEP
jgi:hypothetical protein